MRESLTILAIALILALTAALVGPYFVDWAGQRGRIETYLARGFGVQLTTSGAIDLRLLPSPVLALAHVEADAREGAAHFVADDVRIELALTSLLRGEIRLVDVGLVRPKLTLRADARNGFVLPDSPGRDASQIRIERIDIADGSLNFVTISGGITGLGGIDARAEAASLNGPFKASGRVGRAGASVFAKPFAFTLNTAASDKGRTRVKLVVEANGVLPRADFEGGLIMARAGDGQSGPGFEGQANFAGVFDAGGKEKDAGISWRVTSALMTDFAGAHFDGTELRAGEDERGISASGSADVKFANKPQADVRLNFKQLDLDRPPFAAAAVSGAGARLADFLKMLTAVPSDALSGSLALGAGIVTVNGDALTDVAVHVGLAPGAPAQISGSAKLPGRSAIEVNGALEAGPSAAFKGRADFSTKDPARLDEWLGTGFFVPVKNAGAQVLPRNFTFGGEIEVSPLQTSATQMAVTLDRSRFTGAMTYAPALGQARGRLVAELASDALDIDGVPDFSALAPGAQAIDLALTLYARAVRIARIGEGVLDMGRIVLKASKTGAEARLEQLTIANLGGASVSATGRSGAAGLRLDAQLDAARLGDLAGLINRLMPGEVSDAFVARAAALSPARVDLTLEARADAPGAAPALSALRLEGSAGGTKISAQAIPEAGSGQSDMRASLTLDAPEIAPLLRQLGLDSVPLNKLGRGRVSASLRQSGQIWSDIIFDADLAATKLRYRGDAAAGRVTLASPDITPLTDALGYTLSEAASGAASAASAIDMASEIVIGGGHADLQNLAGTFGIRQVSGALRVRTQMPAASSEARVSGALGVNHFALADLAGLALGSAQPRKTGALWSDLAFGAALADPPSADVALKIGALELGNGLAGRAAALRLKISPGLVVLDEMAMALNDGRVGGRVELRRNGPAASVSGRVTLAGVRAAAAPFSARLSGDLEFASAGQSAALLAAGLAGSGKMALSGLSFPGLDIAAVPRVAKAADEGAIPLEELRLGAAIAAGFPRADFLAMGTQASVTLASGVARFGPVALAPTNLASASLAQGAVRASASAAFDFRNFGIDVRMQIVSPEPVSKFWSGDPAEVSVSWKGPFERPVRSIDASALTNGLAAASILRDTERLAALDADIRERAAFNRRLKAIEQERQRLLAEQEAARLAAEEDKRRLADAARRAADLKARKIDDQIRILLDAPGAIAPPPLDINPVPKAP